MSEQYAKPERPSINLIYDTRGYPGSAVAMAACTAMEISRQSPPVHFQPLYSAALSVRGPVDILCGERGSIGRFKMRDAIR